MDAICSFLPRPQLSLIPESLTPFISWGYGSQLLLAPHWASIPSALPLHSVTASENIPFTKKISINICADGNICFLPGLWVKHPICTLYLGISVGFRGRYPSFVFLRSHHVVTAMVWPVIYWNIPCYVILLESRKVVSLRTLRSWVFMNGISAIIKQTPENPLTLLLCDGTVKKYPQ